MVKANKNKSSASADKTTSKKVTSSIALHHAVSRGKRSLVFLLKILLAMLSILAFYVIYLDAKVRDKFEGQRWQVPVQVFGKIIDLQAGDKFDLKNIVYLLKSTEYAKVDYVTQPGEFALSQNRIIIYRRAFDFGHGLSEAKKFTVDFSEGQVSHVFQDSTAIDKIKLEPFLVDRIVPENKQDRILVSLQSVPENFLDALLLVEDRDFYYHLGISPFGILRAFYQNLRAGRTVQGGSTLTQQLVKNMYLSREKTLWRKVNEAIIALLVEYHYSKDQLLEAYINEVYLGQNYAHGVYGFGLAAQFYFGKAIAQLNFAEMATLIAVIKGPSYYDPWRYAERTKTRRDLVLRLMFKHEQLTKSEFISALQTSLNVRQKRKLNSNKKKFPAYLQLVKREIAQHVGTENQTEGMRVFTNFSIYSQQLLEQTVAEQLISLSKKSTHSLQAAMVVTEINSGEIKALVGGKKSGYAGFNRALNAKRPIGSLIKPAIYLAALERYEEFQLGSTLNDEAIRIVEDNGKVWQPNNYDGQYRGQVTLIDALVYSLNIPTVNLGIKVGLDNVADAMHLLGYPEDIVLRPSMLLGALNMSPYQVNQFYLPIANQGQHVKGHVLDKVVSAQGETLWQFRAINTAYFSQQASFLLDYALSKVTEVGTAKSLTWRLKNKTMAGKTGTTNEQRDSWFVGYDGQHLVTTWLGRDDNKPTDFTGSSGALVLFSDFMKKQGVTNKKSQLPSGVDIVGFEQLSGFANQIRCPSNRKYPAIIDGLSYRNYCSEEKQKVSPKKTNWFQNLFSR